MWCILLDKDAKTTIMTIKVKVNKGLKAQEVHKVKGVAPSLAVIIQVREEGVDLVAVLMRQQLQLWAGRKIESHDLLAAMCLMAEEMLFL